MARHITHWLAFATLAASVALAGCGGQVTAAGHGTAPSPSATVTPTGLLPRFTDWRFATLSGPGAPLHVLTLDGKTDLTGPTVDANARALTISPNGHTIAYLTAPKFGPVTLLDLAARAAKWATITVPITTGYLFGTYWSPDGAQLAISGTLNGIDGLYLVNAQSGKITLVPGTGAGGANAYLGASGAILGWTDDTHLVANGSHGTTDVLDVTSGEVTSLQIPSGLGLVGIAPGGRQALLLAGCGACCIFTPDVAVYDFATGAIRHLPNITAATDGQGPGLWQPGTSLAVGVLHPLQRTSTQMALFDLAADTVTLLQPNLVPEGWLPDGQTLLLATPAADSIISAYFTENPVAPTTQPVSLPSNITNVLGFVRTAGGPAEGSIAPVTTSLTPARWNAQHTASGSLARWAAHPLALPRCG
jgi:hypothetical protein